MRRFGLGMLVLLFAVSFARGQTTGTALNLAADTTAPAARQLVHLGATLTGAINATGTVTFSDGATIIATVNLNAQGPTYLGVASLTAGSHMLTAAYSGDAANASSNGSLTLLVSGIPAPFTVSASLATLYANSSTALSALSLPANATGSIAFSEGASTLADIAITGVSTPGYQAFGGSITTGLSISNPTQRYVNEVAASGGFALTNYAAAGSIACDLLPYQILSNGLNPTQESSPLSSVMIGTNDLSFQVSQPYEPLFRQCHQAALAWLAIPREYKILPTDPGVSLLSGSWNAAASFDVNTFGTLFNSSGSGTARFSITTAGAPIYLWYLLGDSLSGSFTITLDGVPTNQTDSTQPSTPINSSHSPSIGYALLRLSAAQGPHTVDIAVQSGSVGILAVTTPPSPGLASVHPTVIATDIPSQLITNPAAPDATIATYSQDIQNDIALLAGDGLDIRLVATEPFMQGSPAEMADQTEPNALGQTHLAQAFESTLANVPTVPFASFANTAPTANVSFANPGNQTVTATYSGDPVYSSATATLSVNVLAQATTATTLATPVTHDPFGAAVTFTATVSPQHATGTVTFYDGTQAVAQLPLIDGAATWTSSNLAVGIHSLLASYSGDAADVASASPQLEVEIEPTPTILTFSPLPSSSTYTPVTSLSANISPSSAGGAILFYDGSTQLGQSTIASGAASLSTTLTVGTHTLKAKYNGDPSDLPTSSPAQIIAVQPIATSVVLASLPATLAYGSLISLTANVSPPSATGAVRFVDSVTGDIAQANLNNGVANAYLRALTVGSNTVTAIYDGDTTHAQSSSQPATTQVIPSPTTIGLAAIPASIDAGTPVTLKGQLVPASATGSVIFHDAVAGTIGESPVVRGVATLTLSSLAAASYSITAQYSGDSLNAPSTSAAVATQIVLAPTTVTLAQPATALYGSAITLKANLNSATATGTMQFSDAAGPLATALVSNGAATVPLATLRTGSHTIRASYSGDALHAASVSTWGTTLVTPDPTATTLTLAQTNIPAGGLITFNVAVANTQGANPTGVISIHGGTATLAQAPLINASNGMAYATISISANALGAYSATASYAGDTNDLASASAPAAYTVIATPTVAKLLLSSTPVPLQTPVTLTAIVASANAVPTGSVVFTSNGTVIATVSLNTVGQASTIIAAPPLGASTISATYIPTGLFAASTAETETLTVTLPVALTVTPASINAAPGSSQTASLTITPLSKFSGAVTTVCQSPAPWLACNVTAPASVNAVPVSAPISITLKTNTVAAMLPFLTLLLSPLALHRRRRRGVAALVLSAALLSTSACGQGGSFFNIPDGPQQLILAVTAAGVTVTTPLTVNISQ